MTVMHARLVDDSRYVAQSSANFIPRPSVAPDGTWRPATMPWELEYECADHPWLGWIPDTELYFHAAAPCHRPERTMQGPWRVSPRRTYHGMYP